MSQGACRYQYRKARVVNNTDAPFRTMMIHCITQEAFQHNCPSAEVVQICLFLSKLIEWGPNSIEINQGLVVSWPIWPDVAEIAPILVIVAPQNGLARQTWVDSGPNFTEIGRNLPSWLQRGYPCSSDNSPAPPPFPNFVNVGEFRARSDRIWSNSTLKQPPLGLKLTNVEPSSSRLSPEFGQVWPGFDRLRSTSALARRRSARIR